MHTSLRCPSCGYDLRTHMNDKVVGDMTICCPECGRESRAGDIRAMSSTSGRADLIRTLLPTYAFPVVLAVGSMVRAQIVSIEVLAIMFAAWLLTFALTVWTQSTAKPPQSVARRIEAMVLVVAMNLCLCLVVTVVMLPFALLVITLL
ncbi:MAG: hypothetical protein AAF432_16255 [Planctomycetota bacterium]